MTTVTITDIGSNEVSIPVTDTSDIIVQTLSDGPPIGNYIADHSLCINLESGNPHPQYVLDSEYSVHTSDTTKHYLMSEISITTAQISDFDAESLITAVEAAELTGAANTALHYHTSDRARANHTGTQALTTIVTANTINNPLNNLNLEEFLNTGLSSGVTNDVNISINTSTGQVTITASSSEISFFIRSTTDGTGTLYSATIAADSSLYVPANSTRYLYIDYNSGTPSWNLTADPTTINMSDKVAVAILIWEGSSAWVVKVSGDNVDANAKYRKKTFYNEHFTKSTGGVLTNPSSMNIGVTAGVYWFGLTEYDHDALIAGISTFKYYYYNGSLWAVSSSATSINPTQYNNTASGLATMTTKYYTNHWIYATFGISATEYSVVYGQAEYKSLAEAQEETPPTLLPEAVANLSYLVGVVTVSEDTGTIIDIRQNTSDINISSSGPALIANASPASSSTGTPGQLAYDGTYLYVCYDTNLWGRMAFTTGY